MNKSEQLAKLKSGHYITSSTDLAASLMACGCNPLQSSPCTNTYTDKKPYRSGMPGEVLYHLEKNSSTFNASTEKLAHGYNSKDANEVLDSLIERIEDLNLKNQIK